MKKTLIAVAALAATGAFAQVSVYGRLDAGYGNYKTEVDGDTVKRNGVQSGNSASSMWGIQGSEDLGGGMKAMFKLEQDLYPSNGTNSVGGSTGAAGQAGFNRISIVGVSGAFGTVAFGRDYVPTFKLAAATDVMSQSRIDTVQLASAVGSTVPDLIHYSTPNMSGFQLNVAYGNTDTTNNTLTGDSTVKVTNVSGTYMNGPLMVGVATGSTESLVAGVDSTTASYFGIAVAGGSKASVTTLGASYNFGTFSLAGNVINAKVEGTGGEVKASEMNIGAVVPMGKVTLRAQIGTNDFEVGGAEADGNDLAVGAEYALSAKTALFAKTGTMGKLSDAAGTLKTTGTAVGIRTVF